jgi:uncharacterized protein (DUF305 family)
VHPRTRTACIALLAVVTLLATACNAEPAGISTVGEAPEAAETHTYNDADVAFLLGMIPHHDQAVEMAMLVPERTDRPELNDLAERIIAAQEAEIAEMEAMLDEAGVGRDDLGGHGGHGAADRADGMMDDHDMARLADLAGLGFDLAFIDMMIEHHQGAVVSARQVIADGEHPQVRRLAEEIIAAQEAEIAEMAGWREEWATA